jgi:tRNA G18 (ribose-2'-O)-methylase SpoU
VETVIPIDDFEDERIALYRNIRDAQLYRREGLFLLEGTLVVQHALRHSKFALRSVLVQDKKLDRLKEDLENHGESVAVFVAPDTVIDQIVGFDFHRGVIALGARCALPGIEEITKDARRILLLEGIANPDNVGSLFRNAAALGVDAVLLDPSCADPLYRMATRVSIGTTLSLPWTRVKDWPEDLHVLKEAGFSIVGLTPVDSALDIRMFPFSDKKYALLLGSEGPGLKPDTLANCDQVLRIPMHANIDSLNVATAAAVALFTLDSWEPASPVNSSTLAVAGSHNRQDPE